MVINKVIDTLAAQGEFVTNRMLFETVLYYHGSLLMNIANIKKSNGSNINYYGISFAGSGNGKDFAYKTVANAFNIDNREYVENMRASLAANTGKFSGLEPYTPKEMESMINSLPLGHELGLDGTREGIFSAAKAQSVSNYGSFNVASSEFGDIINNSSELLSTLKEFYDGSFKAKIIKSDNVSAIKDITVNLMAFGSHAGLDYQAKKEFGKLASSGMYRRSFIIDIKPHKTEVNNLDVDVTEVYEYLAAIYRKVVDFADANIAHNNNNLWSVEMTIQLAAEEEMKNIRSYLIEQSNEDIYNDIKAAEKGASGMIENLGYIIAFLEDRKVVEAADIQAAFDFYKRCRATTQEIFDTKRPFRMMYDMIKRQSGITMSDMVSSNPEVPSQKSKFADEMLLVEEHCYINGEVLTKTGAKVERYNISELPVNDNTKLIVSICVEDKGKNSINYAPMEVPLFGENNSIEALVKSTEPASFCLAQFEPSRQAHKGHRRAESFISGQNVVGFDIDDSMPLAEAIELLKPYTYLIYTTKSHQKEKNGKILDRFRIILPTKNTFYVDEEQHKELYDNIAEVLGIQIYDRQTRNVSRFWFTNQSCEIYTNIAENIDVTATMPETTANKRFIESMDTLAANYDDRTMASINGIMKWFFVNTSKGNRSDHLFRIGRFIKDLGEQPDRYIEDWNAMLDDPMKDAEIRSIINSVNK